MYGSRRQQVFGLMLVTLAVGSARVAAGADRAPTTAPTKFAAATQPLPELAHAKRLIAQLADNDFDRREAARVALMGLRRSDLPALREAVRQSLPLMPSQLTVLREIVTHVYLTGDVYLPDQEGIGFLGVSLPSGFDPDQRGALGIQRGVAVLARSPGFAAYRMLQNGDVVLAVNADGDRAETNTTGELQEAIRSVKAGETVKLEILRQGQILTVVIKLDPRPFNLSNVGFDEMSTRRSNEADDYWDREFAPLLDDKVV
jgi:hypothetical protein